ncbi:hypothetical protein ACERC8_03755 [Streptococcus sp. E29BA]|uniref:hypothetical protein n=1 Tax=Streptococcus sp. E29BA TaxID=3278716 RepID=UPI00359E4F75
MAERPLSAKPNLFLHDDVVKAKRVSHSSPVRQTAPPATNGIISQPTQMAVTARPYLGGWLVLYPSQRLFSRYRFIIVYYRRYIGQTPHVRVYSKALTVHQVLFMLYLSHGKNTLFLGENQ